MIDVVIGGPDMSGTSTQISDSIDTLQTIGKTIKDLRGTELDAIFHAEIFQSLNAANHSRLSDFLVDPVTTDQAKADFFSQSFSLLSELKIAAAIENNVTTYINPLSADVWIMEEPSRRGAGQVNRTIDLYRSHFSSESNQMAAAHCHSTYRTEEYLRFRRAFRETDRIIIRSRSEESGCYQIHDTNALTHGVTLEEYITLPGHAIAFQNAPTHLFIVCGPADWSRSDYLELKATRSGGRLLDDYEQNVEYQLMVNQRYATDWLEEFYVAGCARHGGTPPIIHRFNIYDTREEIKIQMSELLIQFLQEREIK